MFNLLAKKIIKNSNDYDDPSVRQGYGILSGIVGIVLNMLLFAAKLIAGIMTGALAVIADAFNNLTDAGSSIITVIGFRLASKPTDREHPFGHGRIEYIAGLIVSMVTFLVGFELIKSSIEKLITPELIDFSWISVGIMGAAVFIKLYMYAYNNGAAKKIDSAAMRAVARDSLADCIATSAVLISLLLFKFAGWQTDAVIGIVVALFILFNGLKSAKETVGLLIGEAPDPDYVHGIAKTVLSMPGIIGIHDLIVHNYGPGRQIISLHAEVSSEENINIAHEYIDNAEKLLEDKFRCIAVIHMDPVVTDDLALNDVKAEIVTIVKEVDPDFTIHDFRMTHGATNSNLIFDVVITHKTKLSHDEIKEKIIRGVKDYNPAFNVVCQIEYSYVGD